MGIPFTQYGLHTGSPFTQYGLHKSSPFSQYGLHTGSIVLNMGYKLVALYLIWVHRACKILDNTLMEIQVMLEIICRLQT